MVLPPRHLTTCGLVAGLAALSAGADQCGGGGSPSCPALGFNTPVGFGEWIPGGPPVSIAWTISGGDARARTVDLELVDGDRRYELGALRGDASPFSFAGTDAGGAAVPPGNYEIEATLDCAGAPVGDGPLRLVVVQGLTFRDAALTFTGSQSQAMRQVVLTTVTRAPIAVDLIADPSPAAGDELVFARTTVPGELVPVARSYPFTGMTITATAVPAGTYAVRARISEPGLAYQVDGPMLDWQPAL